MDFEVLKNRMNNGTPFLRKMAVERIHALANNLVITQVQAEELLAIAENKGMENLPQDLNGRLQTAEEKIAANAEAIDLIVSGATV